MINDITGSALFFILVLLMVKPWGHFEAWIVNKVNTSNWDHGRL